MTQFVDRSVPTLPKALLALLSKRLIGLTARRTGFCIGLSGAAGIGKTHTALQLLQASPCRFKVTPSTVGIQALTNLLRGSKKLPGVIERNLQRIQNGERLELQTLTDVYAAMLSPQAPFVLLIEDMHEASTEQMEFWNALCKLVTRLPGVAVIQTSRARFADPVENIALEPLSPVQSKSLLEAHLNAKLPSVALDWIDSRCAGNPLFTLEFADFLTRHDALWNDGKTWKWREPAGNNIPNTVEAILGQWLTDLELTSTARAALETKAYFETRAPGQGLDDSLWATLSGLSSEQISAATAQLEAVGVLKQHTFAHPLYREMTAQHANRQRLDQLALRAVKHFELHDQVLMLPFLDEAKLDRNTALELLESAANQARESGDAAGAGRLLARAAEFAQGEKKGELALKAARALRNVDALKALELVETASYCLSENIEALFLMADLLATQRKSVEFKSLLLRFPEKMKNKLSWAENLVRWYYVFEDYETLSDLLNQYPELKLTSNLSVLFFIIQYFEMMEKNDEIVPLAQKVNSLDCSNLTALERIRILQIQNIIFSIQQNYLKNELTYHEIIKIAKQNSMQLSLCESLYSRGILRREKLGKIHEALEDFTEAIKVSEKLGSSISYYANYLEIGIIKILSGEFEIAEKIIFEAKNYFKRTSLNQCILCCESLVNLYYLWNNNHKKTLISKYVSEAIELFKIIKTPYYTPNIIQMKAFLSLQTEEPKQCFEFANQLLIGYQDFKVQALRIQGLALIALNQKDAAMDALKRAMLVAHEELNIFEEQVTGLELDNLTCNLSSARERLEWFKSQGLNAYVQLAQRYFPELLETNPPTSTANVESSVTLEVLGQMRVQTQGKTEVVRGQKRQELLALLLHARMEGRSEVQVDDLRESLYPDQSLKEGSNALRQTIHKTRSSYGQQVIVTTSSGYALGQISSDAETFLKDGNSQLWRDTYLNGIQLDGSDSILENLNLRLSTRGTELLEHDPKETARIAVILLASNPYDLEALRLQCLGLRQMGQHAALKRKFQAARASFLEIGEHLPETWAQFLDI